METTTLGYVILYVADVAASVDFYERAFGLSPALVHESGTYAELKTGATKLAFAAEATAASGPVFERARPDRPAPAMEVALVTREVAALYDRALAAGAVGVVPPADKPWGQTVGYVRDRNGFLVEICSPIG